MRHSSPFPILNLKGFLGVEGQNAAPRRQQRDALGHPAGCRACSQMAGKVRSVQIFC